MGVNTGMRGKDLQKFLMVAREFNVILLIRHTNADSLKYADHAGYYPKPAVVKAKTADKDPPPITKLVNGRKVTKAYHVAGLVVHPGFHPDCYGDSKKKKAADCWMHTMETLAPHLANTKVDPANPATWSIWGVERTGVKAPRWQWRIDIDPASDHFGCLQLKNANLAWSYVHGDYDLKDVIVAGRETDNRGAKGTLDGVPNITPVLYNVAFEKVQNALNNLMGVEMVQHGAEAQFAWHGDEPITVAFPDWRHLILYDAMTVQSWYANLNREILVDKKKQTPDYLGQKSKWFTFGPQGMFAPGADPFMTWG